jgi:hypothetical protein
VKIWEDEKGMETTLPLKINLYRIQREVKKTNTHIQTPTEQKQTMPKNPRKPTRTL